MADSRMLPLSDTDEAWVLGVLYSRGLAGSDAETALLSARRRTPSRSFDEWLAEIAALESVDSGATTYGQDAMRVAWMLHAAQLAVIPRQREEQ